MFRAVRRRLMGTRAWICSGRGLGVLGALLVLAFAGQACAGDDGLGKVVVTGQVVNEQGLPFRGASVSATTQPPADPVKTDVAGKFRLLVPKTSAGTVYA